MARFFQPQKKASINTKHQTILVERLDHQGCGIAYQQGKPIFIAGALPGEEVLMQLTESKSKYARAKLIKVLTESAERVTPFCVHYQQCGGCDLQHLGRDAQLEQKQNVLRQLMSKLAKQDLPLSPTIIGQDKGYRRRARISLLWDRKTQQMQFGFRQKQSNTIVNITQCAVLEPELERLLKPLRQLVEQLPQPDSLGHIELVQQQSNVVMILRHTKALSSEALERLTQFSAEHNLQCYLMPQPDTLERLYGADIDPSYQEVGVKIAFKPTNFIQVNREINQQMVTQALSWLDLTKDDRVLDLFCGVGNFSLPMAALAKSVVGIEGVESMVEQAKYNAEYNQIDNIDFYQANLEQEVTQCEWAEQKFDKVLLDPARAGASEIVDQLAMLGASRVVYVSCNPATLARDSQSLVEQGFTLEKLAMLDMFPHTSHLESMALFVQSA
jgi:23S rRNA (uracil1939-C5)-methyltransferase